MQPKKPSRAQTEKKAPAKPKAKPTPKKTAKRATKPKAAPAPQPQATKWRVASKAPAATAEPEKTPDVPREVGRALMVIPQPEPLTPWQEFKAALPESFESFCAFIAEGGHLAAFCGERGIPYTTFLTWIQADPSRSEMYARVREERADVLADEIIAISDERVATAPAASRNKLRVEARKWAASKLKPRVYGDKIEIGATINHKSISDEKLLERLAGFGIAMASITPKAQEASDDA